jgi:uncharacterized protein YdeI (BOF family)
LVNLKLGKMKKLIVTLALVVGSFTAFAQAKEAVKTEAKVQAVQDNFKEIKAEETPEAVTKALKTAYPDATLSKVYVNDKKEYKLEIAVEDQKTFVFTDAAGKLLKR